MIDATLSIGLSNIYDISYSMVLKELDIEGTRLSSEISHQRTVLTV